MTQVAAFIQIKIAEVLGLQPKEVHLDEEFINLGLDSMHAIFLLDELEKEYNIEINPHSFWEFPTIHTFAKYLEQRLPKS